MAVRIAVISTYAPSLVNFRGSLLKAMEQLGAELLLIAPKLNSDILTHLELQKSTTFNIEMERNGTNPIQDLTAFFLLWKYLHKFNPDIVLAYSAKAAIYGTLAAYLSGVTQRYVLINGLGSPFTQNSSTPSYITWVTTKLYRLSLRYNTAVIFQNPDDEELFRKSKILSSSTLTHIVNGSGVDIDHFSPSPLPESAIFLLMARLIGDKGIREYVAAAQQVRLKYPQARFMLTGEIDSNPTAISSRELQTWIDTGNIEYLGFIKDPRSVIAKCSVYVLPSYREGTPRSVLEAMAMGRPIITTDVPGCRETVKHGINGYLIPCRNVNALVGSMEQLIIGPELRYQFGIASRCIAEEKYDVHKVNQQMLTAMGLTENP